MATLSLRMRDDLKEKAQELAKAQGVSLNGFINATLAATIAQHATLSFFGRRLDGVDEEALVGRVLEVMRQSRPGREPSPEEIERAIQGER